jgi:hypothetical protein
VTYNQFSNGGPWLGAAREVLQRKAKNGDWLTWGSHEVVEGLTVRDVEELAHVVARAAAVELVEKMQLQEKRLNKLIEKIMNNQHDEVFFQVGMMRQQYSIQ